VPKAVIGDAAGSHLYAAMQRTGRPLWCNHLAWLRRFQYTTIRMATQHAALIAKHVAIPQSERLMIAYATVERCASRNKPQVVNEIEDATFLSVAALRICGT